VKSRLKNEAMDSSCERSQEMRSWNKRTTSRMVPSISRGSETRAR
jgi:hypothetical protein